MGHIVAGKAYANNEAALIAWSLDAPIPNCLGFEITRIYLDTNEERVLAAWVPFKGQSNKDWKPQTTSVWPVQKLFWRDLTVRQRRDQATWRPTDVSVKYRIRPLVTPGPGLQPVTNVPEKTYEGNPVPLAYADEGLVTNDILITAKHGDFSAAFTNGILAAQWLKHVLEALGQKLTPDVLRGSHEHQGRQDPAVSHRRRARDVARAPENGPTKEKARRVLLALYELSDEELKDLIIARKKQVRLILSNSSKGSGANTWDATNSGFRTALRSTPGLEMYDRMFNNAHIGHNKFAVLVGADGTPKAVMTGSTNWTPTGLCGQSNNAVIIESPDVAKAYSDYWDRLFDDTKLFKTPEPLTAPPATHRDLRSGPRTRSL